MFNNSIPAIALPTRDPSPVYLSVSQSVSQSVSHSFRFRIYRACELVNTGEAFLCHPARVQEEVGLDFQLIKKGYMGVELTQANPPRVLSELYVTQSLGKK